ncbi:MAG TPA: DUF1223 domain-containing protein [Pyrinomonadaceae bacterium]|jgi:hypothetical protein
MRKFVAIVFVVAALAAVAAAALSAQRARKGAEPKKPSDAGVAADQKTTRRAPVVVELFTSEGCSSCPPADAVLARLDKEQPVEGAEVIPLAMHVDYWNQLGWADPFSSSEFSRRQGEYASAYGKDGVYTPQMIVDGVKEFAGGNENAALEAVARAAREPKSEALLTRGPSQTDEMAHIFVRIDGFPKQTEGDSVYVLLAVTESGLSSNVSRGENSGRKLGHVGVVRVIKQLGILPDTRSGGFRAETGVMVEKGWRRESLRAVVFAQERGTRRVLAAGSLKLYD